MAKQSRPETRKMASGDESIKWRDWSAEAFAEAASAKKLVLLDLSAQWCHWCHVMDETTYSDADVIRTINQDFIPIRVDIDRRPDISERYNRGGFPTTAFLSDQGESLWGATYIPPGDMKRVLKEMLESKARGEVDQAIAQERMQYLDLSKSMEKNERVDAEFVDAIFEDIFSVYDVEWGGFGNEPKFPHADAVDLLLERYRRTKDAELAAAVRSTLDHMTRGLYDAIEGGVFRYSVKRDWTVPHYEKMLDTNLGFLRNLVGASLILGDQRFRQTADGVASYLMSTLLDRDTGAFFSSQDADEEYYKLDKDLRRERGSPKVITEIFSGLTCQASSVLAGAGILMDQRKWVEAGRSAWEYVIRELWDEASSLVRHSKDNGLYLFEDQVDFLEALIAITQMQSNQDAQKTMQIGERLIKSVDRTFAHPDGGYGDVAKDRSAIGKLAEPQKPLPANSRWARGLAAFGAAAFQPELIVEAWKVLSSFSPKRVQASGIFASDYVFAWDILQQGLRTVEIHGIADDITGSELWRAAKRTMSPAIVVLAAKKPMLEIKVEKPFAVICKDTGCSKEIFEPKELASQLGPALPGQI